MAENSSYLTTTFMTQAGYDAEAAVRYINITYTRESFDAALTALGGGAGLQEHLRSMYGPSFIILELTPVGDRVRVRGRFTPALDTAERRVAELLADFNPFDAFNRTGRWRSDAPNTQNLRYPGVVVTRVHDSVTFNLDQYNGDYPVLQQTPANETETGSMLLGEIWDGSPLVGSST